MKSKESSDASGLRLPKYVLGVLRQRGIFAQPSVRVEHQHLARRYVVRGLESGGAVDDLGHYVTFAREDGQPLEYLHPVESIGADGLHSVVLAPSLVRIEMLRTDNRTTQPAPELFGERKRLAEVSQGEPNRFSHWSLLEGRSPCNAIFAKQNHQPTVRFCAQPAARQFSGY